MRQVQIIPTGRTIKLGCLAEALDRWFEDLQGYEQNLESMASASLDPRFKDELQHVDQWFSYLNEAERTATVYTLLQHSSQVQMRFFITVLQQMGKKDPVGSLLSPAHPEKGTHKEITPLLSLSLFSFLLS